MRETLLSLTGISDAEVSDSDDDSDDDKMMMIITHWDGLYGVALADDEVSDSHDDNDDDKMMMIITHRDGLCGVALADDGQRAGSGAHSAGGRRGEAENVGNKRLLRLVYVSVAVSQCRH